MVKKKLWIYILKYNWKLFTIIGQVLIVLSACKHVYVPQYFNLIIARESWKVNVIRIIILKYI